MKWQLALIFLALAVTIFLAACDASPPAALPTPDLVATEVAVQKAAAATLTAEAPPSSPTETATLSPTPTLPPNPAPTQAAETAPPPTATETVVPPTNTPEPTPIPPTPTPLFFAVVPVDGADDNDFLQGRRIILPGIPPEQVSIPPVLRDRLVFRVEAYDTRVGTSDGDGIERVDITIRQDENDEIVHQRTEQNAGYCVFGGGEPDCGIWIFAEHDYRWPGGRPIVNGTHRVAFDITSAVDHQTTQWRWSFVIDDPRAVTIQPGMIEAEIIQTGLGHSSEIVSDILVFQVEAFHTGYGNNDGDGISHVDMSILDSQGEVVHERTERTAGYCAFGGGEPDCNELSLEEAEPGSYTLQAVVYAQDGQSRTISKQIEIEGSY